MEFGQETSRQCLRPAVGAILGAGGLLVGG
jgi:hypothetical protein